MECDGAGAENDDEVLISLNHQGCDVLIKVDIQTANILLNGKII